MEDSPFFLRFDSRKTEIRARNSDPLTFVLIICAICAVCGLVNRMLSTGFRAMIGSSAIVGLCGIIVL